MTAKTAQAPGTIDPLFVMVSLGNLAAMVAASLWSSAANQHSQSKPTGAAGTWVELFVLPDNSLMLVTLGTWLSVSVAMLAYHLWIPVPARRRILYALASMTSVPLTLIASHLILH